MSNFHIFFSIGSTSWELYSWFVMPACVEHCFIFILRPKSYLVQAHKPQISPRHVLGLVLGHVMGFLQPALGPLGYLVVKEISKCGQL